VPTPAAGTTDLDRHQSLPTLDVRRPQPRVRRRSRRLRTRSITAVAAIAGLVLLTYGVHDAFPSPPPGTAAASTVAQTVNAVATDLGHQEQAIRRCGTPAAGATDGTRNARGQADAGPAGTGLARSSADALACIQAQDVAMASTLHRFAESVEHLALPSAADTARSRLIGSADTLSDDLRALGSTTDEQQYRAVASLRHFGPLGSELDRAAEGLLDTVQANPTPAKHPRTR